MNRATTNPAPYLPSNFDRSISRLAIPPTTRRIAIAVLILAVAAVLSISGCSGATGASKSVTQQTQTSTAAPATISIAPASIAFGSVAVGGTVSQSVTVTNGGGSDLSVTQVSTAASGVTITGASFPMTIPAGGQANFDVVFAPKAAGALSASVSVMSSASTVPSTVAVSGTAVAAAVLLNANTPSLNFGSVAIGASATQVVTLSNAGNSNVTISNVAIAGANVTTSGVGAGVTLAPGQSANLTVIYSPLAAGTLAGTVTVVSNASNSPSSILLSGSSPQSAAHSVTLSWAPSTSSDVAGYNVYRSGSSSGPYVVMNSSKITATKYTDSTVQGGQTYYYESTSLTSDGLESAASSVVSATVPAN